MQCYIYCNNGRSFENITTTESHTAKIISGDSQPHRMFAPFLANLSDPLNDLLKKDTPW